MKTKRKLTIGREYYLDARKDVTGVLVKTDEDSAYFKCTSSYNPYTLNAQGLIPFWIFDSNQFKEVNMKEEKYSNRKSCLIILLTTAVLWGGIIALILAL